MPSPSARCARLEVAALDDRCVPSAASVVRSLYATLLHRSPAPAETVGRINALHVGTYPREIISTFVTSAEYGSQIVTGAYRTYLHRATDASLAGWVGLLRSSLNP